MTIYKLLLLGLALVALSTANATACEDDEICEGPIITTTNKTEIILQKGENFTLTCKGTTEIEFRQQEASEYVLSDFNITVNHTINPDAKYSHQIDLHLFNVDQYAIGYYICADNQVDPDIVNNLIEEPENDEHSSYIYVYVNGTDSLFAPMREIITPKANKVVIECRPTTPDVIVNLTMPTSQNKTPEYVQYSSKIGFVMKTCSRSAFLCKGHLRRTERKHIRFVEEPPLPEVYSRSQIYVRNESFSLNCTVDYEKKTIVNLSWTFPNGLKKEDFSIDTNEFEGATKKLYKNITVYNASEKYAGLYTCVSGNTCGAKSSKPLKKVYKSEPYLILRNSQKKVLARKSFRLVIYVEAYPTPRITLYKDGKPENSTKYDVELDPSTGTIVLSKSKKANWDLSDIGNYTLRAQNDYNMTNETTTEVFVTGEATIVNFDTSEKFCVIGTKVTLSCEVSGFPLPNITWQFTTADINITKNSTSNLIKGFYNATAFLDIHCTQPANITCMANNTYKTSTNKRNLLIYEMAGGFGIVSDLDVVDNTRRYLEKQNLTLKCLASKYTFSNVTWLNQDAENTTLDKEFFNSSTYIPEPRTHHVEFNNNSEFSYYSILKINDLNTEDSGNYTCYGVKKDGTKIDDHIQIIVQELKRPLLSDPIDSKDEVYRFTAKILNCIAEGAPLPKIVWYKDEIMLMNGSSNVYIMESFNYTTINSTLVIRDMQADDVGIYKCIAESNRGVVQKLFTLSLKVDVKQTNIRDYLIAIGVIITLLFILVVYLSVKVKKEKRIRKQFRKELSAAGLLYFKEGVTKSINPKLGIDEQAELLPYDEKFEFPLEKLDLGVQLGAGAFGVVYKAEARGIVNAEETTVVAVKMVKKGADNMYIKALATELKIMVHLGKHVNIVNLLGACTKNVDKRELAVIVEYCMFGNIHNYMQKHRDVFIDQLTDNKEKNLGRVNRGFSSSSGAHSDYFDNLDTGETGHTFVNTANTANSEQKHISNLPTEEVKESAGYVQPEWRSNYQSDYSFDGRSPRPLTSRDLIAWAFQIARGMEYLASRKVLHGDLAARNILLAKDNVVKICDFGLARSIYKNSEYKRKEGSPLPIKWLAIECMTSGIFSTQSDVWSFGIVLWELFSLAKTPYPNIHHTDLLGILSAGQRLEKPQYADDRLYEMMLQCWNEKPTLRPSFTRLQELLGTCLEDNVRNYYIDLNNSYMTDKQSADSHEDYLAMMCAPDYNNLVTPSPNHANDASRFFPPSPARVDEEGYLQITPFDPKQGTEFNFDSRKFNAKTSEASSCGSELTPMLNLNNLPTRGGSESDHEGQNPYQNMTRIDEETDEVFVPKENEARQNAKNLQHCAVTNPTYITFDTEIEKNEKPKDIINSYVNINVPNGGLVK